VGKIIAKAAENLTHYSRTWRKESLVDETANLKLAAKRIVWENF
jgi:hypothetical protein